MDTSSNPLRTSKPKSLWKASSNFSDIVYNMADWVWEPNETGRYTYAAGNVKDILGVRTGRADRKSSL
jgi:hypothetical protein